MPRQKKNYSRFRGKINKFNKNSKVIKKNHPKNKTEFSTVDRKRKNFKFIQRSKESEEYQRRQKIIEDKYRSQSSSKLMDEHSEDEDSINNESKEEINSFDELLSTLQCSNGTDDLKLNTAIESSTDEEEIDEDNEESISDSEYASLEEDDEMEEEVTDSEVEDLNEDLSDAGDKRKIDESQTEEIIPETIHEVELDEEIDDVKKLKITDPFTVHLDNELSQQHIDNLLLKPPMTKKIQKHWNILGNLQIEIPKSGISEKNNTAENKSRKVLLKDDEAFASEGTEPQLIDLKKNDFETLQIKPQLQPNIYLANISNLKEVKSSNKIYLNPLQTEIFSIVNNYQDLFYSRRTLANGEEIRLVYCLHVLNHMMKTRSKILHHNAKLTTISSNKKGVMIVPDSFRDQGLIRPKILIILPFRESVYRVVNVLIALLYGDKAVSNKTNGTVINYKRFQEEYTGDSLQFPKTNPKPEDYEQTFAGNTDDTFRIGISLTKKSMKLYSEFYSSDILISSPLGLRMIVGAPGDAERDYDFLSSIEVLVLDQSELFLAQNWDHLLHVFDYMHLQPQSVRNTDFSRVRSWCLNGLSRFYRQTLLFSSHELPEFRSLFNNRCCNYRGKIRIANPIINGSIRSVIIHIPQIFHKLNVSSLDSSFDDRFKYFTNEILPQFKGPSMAHCMIYVPSYFDYVRLRNYFKAETINFVQICEYTKDAKIARARDMFFHSAAHFLLYSERAHFFRRTRIKGIRHLIMYQPPNWPNLYPELINLMQEANQNTRDGLETSMSVTILYSKYDMIQISSIIGTERASKILQSGKKTHMFMTEE